MCGLFGMIRRPDASPLASQALYHLGRLAVERGQDSAGITYVAADDSTYTHRAPGTFTRVFADFDHEAAAKNAVVLLGHTRWATQGDRTNPANVSPMQVSTLTCTHNGDVEVASIPGIDSLARPAGGTDTERLYQAIASEASLEGVTKVLSIVKGRAALAWIDSTQPGLLFLARAALSPLATAYDAEGNLYWASNPDWFRQVDRLLDGAVGFDNITMVTEGTLAVISTATLVVEDVQRFTPLARGKDVRMTDLAVHRGFTREDAKADRASFTHTLVQDAPRPQPVWGDTGDSVDRWWQPPIGGGSRWEPYEDTVDDTFDDDLEWAEEFVMSWDVMGANPAVYEDLFAASSDREKREWCARYNVFSVDLLPHLRYAFETWLEEAEE